MSEDKNEYEEFSAVLDAEIRRWETAVEELRYQ